MHDKVIKFQKKYPTKAGKAKALSKMADEQIDALIQDSPNVHQKIWFSSFKQARS